MNQGLWLLLPHYKAYGFCLVFQCSIFFMVICIDRCISYWNIKGRPKRSFLFNVTLLALAFGAKIFYGNNNAFSHSWRYSGGKLLQQTCPMETHSKDSPLDGARNLGLGYCWEKTCPKGCSKLPWLPSSLLVLGSMVFWDIRKSKTVPTHWSFASGSGILAGLTTMIGNMAGPFTNLYFLMLRLPKNEFVGHCCLVVLHNQPV